MAKDELNLTQEQKDALFAEWNEQAQLAERQKEELRSLNTFSYGGQLAECKLSTPREKTREIDDGKGGKKRVPVLDDEGQPTFWDSQYYCTLIQLGGTEQFSISMELGKDLSIGSWYRFDGSRGGEGKKDKVKVVTQI